MKRLLLLALGLALALAAPAQAKEFVALSVCGTDGCHTTRDHDTLQTAMQVTPQATPGRTGAFYRLRIRIGEPGLKDEGVVRSDWIPSIGLLHADDGPYGEWSLPQPETAAALRRLSEGLQPFGAKRIKRPTARVDEVVPAPAPDAKRESAGGSAWPLSLLALVPLGVFLVMRRRGRWN